ncbi:MAG: DNA modification methylase [Planctomycetes bacterium]|nr:DNA modification methylase [Planctomycetota bacterium]
MNSTQAAQALSKAVGRTLTIQRVPIDSLHLDPANARAHGDKNLDAIKASLARFGQAEPLVVQAGTRRIVGGNGRLVAMKALGWTECDIVELDLTSTDAAALGLALNRSAELATWDQGALAQILGSLREEDALAGVGFDDADIDQLLADLDAATPREVDDQGPEDPPVHPVTRLGDLWTLGDHKLLVGDSTKADDVARLMNGEKAALLSTDSPYAVDYDGMNRPSHDGKPSGKDWSALYHETDIEDLGVFLDACYTACLPHVAEDAACYLWHSHTQFAAVAGTWEKHDILLHQCLIWNKPAATFGHSYYRWKHEPCCFGWRRGHRPKHGTAQLETVWSIDWDGKARITTFHPTSKPVELFAIPMRQHTLPGAIVLEPFNGSGSQIIAAETLSRRCRAIEIQPAFVDGTIARWEKATGKLATLDGKTFDEVKAERGVA